MILQQWGARNWPALNPEYLRAKIADGRDERMLVAYGDYVSEIQARKRAGGRKVEVGLPTKTHPNSQLSYQELGAILEYGHISFEEEGKGIPPRPHWRPAIAQWLTEITGVTTRIRTRIGNRTFRRLKSKFGQKRKKLS